MVGDQLTLAAYQAYIREGWRVSGFDGHRGVVCILVQDCTITRLECLAFAIKFMEGTLINVSVDLRNLTSTITAVIPPP